MPVLPLQKNSAELINWLQATSSHQKKP